MFRLILEITLDNINNFDKIPLENIKVLSIIIPKDNKQYFMYRRQLEQLKEWRNSSTRKPLIIRGARQVGKSYLISQFGREFQNYIEINFEKDITAKNYFAGDLDIEKIMRLLSIYKEKKIIPGETLIFLDEIQECENALKALRYFKEERPDIHVIAAGSLLDFTIEKIGMPVGRVQFLYLYPISFTEFLQISNREDLLEYITKQENEPSIHEIILGYLKDYLLIGGMPAVINSWIQEKDYITCQEIQDEIIESYQQDFYKYAKKNQIEYLTRVFDNIPSQLGNKFKYVNIDREVRSIYFKEALSLLNRAGIINICYHTSAKSQPLGSMIDDRKFKVYLFDVGIAQRILGLDLKQYLLSPITVNNVGKIIEQFVAQELVINSNLKANRKASLYYWHRESKNSNAEVDFLILKNNKIVPVEVKSGKVGRMKSLYIYLEENKNTEHGLKISEGMFAENDNIIEIPLYAIKNIF